MQENKRKMVMTNCSSAKNKKKPDESNRINPPLEQNKSDKTKIEPKPKSNAIHGWTYQLKVLLLIYVRAVACGYQHFYLNTENEKEFGKFDDAIFEYVIEGETFIRLVQIKHVKEEEKEIHKQDLRIKSKYTLTTYFESFLKCKREVKDLILYTNLNFGYDVFTDDVFEEHITPDDIFDVFLPDHKNIATTSLPRDHKDRDIKKIPKKHKLVYTKLKLDLALQKQFLNKIEELNNSKEFKDNGILIEKNSIEIFCKKFIFATGQPNDNEMNSVLEKEIPRISKLPPLESVYFQYFNTFLCWLSNKYENKAPLTPDDMKIIIPLIKLKTENTKINMDYLEKLKDFKYKLEDPTIIQLKNYFKFPLEENSGINYFKISIKFPKLTLAKIFQSLEYDEMTDQGECLFLETIDVKLKEFEEKVKLIEYFKFCVIIFHVGVAKDYENQVLGMLENNKTKVVILNTAVNFESEEKSEDNCCFKHLQPESKTNILNRRTFFDGEYVKLNTFGSNKLFDSMRDDVWLSQLIDGKLVLNKNNLPSLKDNYIERKLIFQTNDTVDTIDNCVKESSDELETTMSENSMTTHYQRLIILKSEAGNGKTTLLASMSKKYTNFWTEIIKLTEHVTVLSNYQPNENVIEFFTSKILKYDSFTAQLFKHQIEEMENVVLMFDGFDEINQNSKDAILNIIDLLKTKVHRIWIASRPNSIDILQKHFSQPIFELTKFTDVNVYTFISDYWSKNKMEYEEKQLALFCRNLHIRSNIDFLVPLYTQMAVEYFKPTHFEEYINKINLYENCIRKKYMHLLGDKIGHNDDGHIASSSILDEFIENYNDCHKQLALQMLCSHFGFKHNLRQSQIKIINSIGFASVNVDDNNIISFDHRTFAEYFLAKYVFDKLACKRSVDDKIFDLLLNFKENKEFRQVLDFINEFLDNSEILPNKIKLTKPEHIKTFKNILDNFFSESVYTFSNNSVLTYIALDNVDIMKYKLDELLYFNCKIGSFSSVNLLIKYFIELEKHQLTSKQQLKESIILCMVQYNKLDVGFLKFTNRRFMKFVDILLREKFPEIQKIVSDYVSLLSGIDSDRYELAFRDFYIKIIESKSVDNLKFSIYSFAQSIKVKHSENTKQYILQNLINASKECEFNFNENGKLIKEIKVFDVDGTFFYYKRLTEAFKHQKQAFMNFLEIPETDLSYDELEMLLTNNVEMFPKKIKNIKKIILTFLISTHYVDRFGYQADIHIKPYFEKFSKYNSEEMLAVCFFIQMKTDFYNNLFFSGKFQEKWLLFIKTLNQPSELVKCFYDNPFLFSIICYVNFFKEIKAPSNSLVYERVFDDISEIHPKLMKKNLIYLIEKSLELDSLELLKKIVAALDKEINKLSVHEIHLHNNLEYIIYKKIYFNRKTGKIAGIKNYDKTDEYYETKYFFDTMTENAKEMCKIFFVDFVKNLKMKIKAPKVPCDHFYD